jgi:hypothetical protein
LDSAVGTWLHRLLLYDAFSAFTLRILTRSLGLVCSIHPAASRSCIWLLLPLLHQIRQIFLLLRHLLLPLAVASLHLLLALAGCASL